MDLNKKYKILLIDDDELFQLMMPPVLSKVTEIDHYEMFDSGWDALDFLKDHRYDHFPDFIFVDLNMPEMDGFEFIDRYQNTFSATHPKTKIVVISNSVLKKDLDKSMNKKVVCEYENKPLTADKVRKILIENSD